MQIKLSQLRRLIFEMVVDASDRFSNGFSTNFTDAIAQVKNVYQQNGLKVDDDGHNSGGLDDGGYVVGDTSGRFRTIIHDPVRIELSIDGHSTVTVTKKELNLSLKNPQFYLRKALPLDAKAEAEWNKRQTKHDTEVKTGARKTRTIKFKVKNPDGSFHEYFPRLIDATVEDVQQEIDDIMVAYPGSELLGVWPPL